MSNHEIFATDKSSQSIQKSSPSPISKSIYALKLFKI